MRIVCFSVGDSRSWRYRRLGAGGGGLGFGTPVVSVKKDLALVPSIDMMLNYEPYPPRPMFIATNTSRTIMKAVRLRGCQRKDCSYRMFPPSTG